MAQFKITLITQLPVNQQINPKNTKHLQFYINRQK
ncbi:MAG: hypothetical protein RIR11_3315 [Bacteroidota bacterium]|jgi:hypothetical protein